AARTGHSTIGRPHSSCSTLGRPERMRVPWPAARIATVGALTPQMLFARGFRAAGGQGLEPRFSGPKPDVLPLDAPPRGRRQEYRTPPAGIAAQMPLGKHVHPGHLQGFSQPPLMSRKTFKGLYAVLAVVLLGAPAVLAAPAPALATPP